MNTAKPRKVGQYMYRSLLESRWAILFNKTGTNFRYELKSFKTDDGYYLPDFFLPDFNVWIEIKPYAEVKDIEYRKIQAVANQTNQICFIFCGFPKVDRNHSEPYFLDSSITIVRPNSERLKSFPINIISSIFDKYSPIWFDVEESYSEVSVTTLDDSIECFLSDKKIIDRYKIHGEHNKNDLPKAGWLTDLIKNTARQRSVILKT